MPRAIASASVGCVSSAPAEPSGAPCLMWDISCRLFLVSIWGAGYTGIGQEYPSETRCLNSAALSTRTYRRAVFWERSTSYACVLTRTSPPPPRGHGAGQRGQRDHWPDPRGGVALRPTWLASRYLLVPWPGAGATAA